MIRLPLRTCRSPKHAIHLQYRMSMYVICCPVVIIIYWFSQVLCAKCLPCNGLHGSFWRTVFWFLSGLVVNIDLRWHWSASYPRWTCPPWTSQCSSFPRFCFACKWNYSVGDSTVSKCSALFFMSWPTCTFRVQQNFSLCWHWHRPPSTCF